MFTAHISQIQSPIHLRQGAFLASIDISQIQGPIHLRQVDKSCTTGRLGISNMVDVNGVSTESITETVDEETKGIEKVENEMALDGGKDSLKRHISFDSPFSWIVYGLFTLTRGSG